MKLVELKRKVGYFDLEIVDKCGNCANCTIRGKHLRCAKHGFAVSTNGICRNGYVQGPRQVELTLPENHGAFMAALGDALDAEPETAKPSDYELKAMWEEHCADERRDEEAAV